MMERSPGTYGPEFLEPGFKENGSYFDAGFQVNVNHYGGNLTISARDVSVAGQGKFELAFTRTFNSNSLYLPGQGVSNQADSPLGEGWVGHYGLLWAAGTPLPGGGPVPHPEFVDSSGARHRFYRHNLLNTEIPISSPGNNGEWISASMEILLKIDNDTYELLIPGGLKYTLERLYTEDSSAIPPQRILRYYYFVPTRVRDCYGNTWEIAYEKDIAPYFEHPLIQSITDGLGRTLNFGYITDQLGKKRLDKVRFNGTVGTVLAKYVYEHVGTHAFLKKHQTGEERVTTYTNDIAPASNSAGSVISAITRIEYPTGGVTVINYDLKQIFYQSGVQTFVYAVTQIQKGGHIWNYNYLNTGSNAPQNNEFKVRVTTTNLENTYTYYTYGSSAVWNSQLWKVGMLINSKERIRAGAVWTETEKTWEYAPFEVSTEPLAANSSSLVSAPRLLSEIVVQDGYSLTTTYPNNMYDNLNFPRRINRPGNVIEEIEYHHVKSGTGGANPKYLLALRASETVKSDGSTVKKTVQNYPSTRTVIPNYVRFHRTVNNYLQVDNEYYSTNGYAGSLRSISYGGYSESYEYENGVVKKLKYPEGPNIERIINRNGTIKEETRNGVKKSFTWDNDFRLTLVKAPDTHDAVIDYNDRNNIVTLKQGTSEIKLTHDQWGRLVERREKIDSNQYAVDSYSLFDAFDRPTQEITRTGSTYSLVYDVHGRLRSRSTPGDAHEYTYTTGANSVKTTDILNGSVITEREVDHLDRILMGSTNGHRVNFNYTSVNNGIQQRITFSQGQAQRTIVHNLLGNKVSEMHPETGSISYEYTPELWLKRVIRPGLDYTFVRDRRGRIKDMKHTGGATISTRSYHPTFGFVSQTEHKGVIVGYSDPDKAGRPQMVKLSVLRPLPIPHITNPLGYLDTSLFDEMFIWETVRDANGNPVQCYEFELWEGSWFPISPLHPRRLYPPQLLYRGEVCNTKLGFSEIGFRPALLQPYWFRVRAKKADGEIGPFSRPNSFVLGIPTTVGYSFAAIPLDPEALPTEQGTPPNTSDDLVDPIQEIDFFLPPRHQPMTPHAVFVVEIEYDGLGRISSVKHPDEDITGTAGNWQKYNFNSQASHKTVTYGGNSIVGDTSYWDNGLSRTMQMPLLGSRFVPIGSFSVNRSYDSLGRIKSHSVTINNESVIYRASQIEYDDNSFGYIKSLHRNDPGLRNTVVGYNYDPWGLLENFIVGGNINTYVYDNAGNLTAQTGLNVQGLTATDINNNPVPASLDLPPFSGVSYNNANQRIGWGYDPDGRLTRDGQWEYTYTNLDQIESIIDPALGWKKAHYLYDADGNRVREVYGHQVVYSIRLPNGQLISQETQFQSYDWTGVKYDFVYYNGTPIAQIRYGKNIEYEFRDRLGNPVVAVQWPLVKYYEYAPYGQQMRTEVLYNLIELEFTGHERDRYTERDYMMARYYDPRSGRFNRPDPAFDFNETNPISFNFYSYVLGNPVSFVDLDGRVPIPVVTGAIGAGAGFVGSVIGQSISKGFSNVDWGDASIAAGAGAVAGALAPFVATKLTGAVLLGSSANVVQYVATQFSNDEVITVEGVVVNAGTGALAGLTGGAFSRPSGLLFGTSSINANNYFRVVANQLNRDAAIKANTGISNLLRSALAGITSNTDPRDLPKLVPNVPSGLSSAERARLLEHGRGLIH